MKKSLLLLMAFVFIISSCNNNKGDKKNSNRDNDDYGKTDKKYSDDENSGNRGWAKSDKNKFLRECEESFEAGQEDISEKICPCVLKKMEKEFDSYDDANTTKGEKAAERLALECKDEVMGSDENNSKGYTWSKSEDNKWMNDCATPLAGTVSTEKANNYCKCILVMLKEIYSSYDEMNTKGTQEMGLELGNKCISELGVQQ